MRFGLGVGLLFVAFCGISPITQSAVCSVNSSGEITDTSGCYVEALSYEVRVFDVLWCTNEPSPSNFDSCVSWDLVPFDFEITETSVVPVAPRVTIPEGTYRWVSAIISPTSKVKAVATFDRVMQGKTNSGKVCWTNGTILVKSERSSVETDASKRSVECGSSAPTTFPPNTIVTDSANWIGGGFGNSASGVLPTGNVYRSYLMTDDYDQSSSANETSLFAFNMQLPNPVVVSNRDDVVQVFDLTYNREMGADIAFSGTNLSIIDGVLYYKVTFSEEVISNQ